MDITWDYANAREYVKRIHHGMPPVHGLFISTPVKPMTQPKARITLPATAKSMR